LQSRAICFYKKGQDGSGKCTLLPERSSRAYGTVFEIAAGALPTLDRIEGVGKGYERVSLEVAEFGLCAVYLASADALDRMLKPYDWYKALVVAGAEAQGFPQDYCTALKAVAAIADPDRERSRLHFALLEP
jgi:gamma-glutamylcyclotransferase